MEDKVESPAAPDSAGGPGPAGAAAPGEGAAGPAEGFAELRRELDALRGQVLEHAREAALRRALAGVAWMDAEDAYRTLLPRVRRDGSGAWVADEPAADGSAAGVPRALAEAVGELARRKPHWVRAQVQGGTGAQGSGGGAGAAGGGSPLHYAELLRPENSAVLQEFIHHRKEELERMRAAYFGGRG